MNLLSSKPFSSAFACAVLTASESISTPKAFFAPRSREAEVLLSFAQNGFEVKERFEEKGWLVFVVKKSK